MDIIDFIEYLIPVGGGIPFIGNSNKIAQADANQRRFSLRALRLMCEPNLRRHYSLLRSTAGCQPQFLLPRLLCRFRFFAVELDC